MYTLALVASDGKSSARAEQDFIGIGDVTRDGEVGPLYRQTCALFGCHDKATHERNYDLSKWVRSSFDVQINYTKWDLVVFIVTSLSGKAVAVRVNLLPELVPAPLRIREAPETQDCGSTLFLLSHA
jgi:hypothetical protein